MLVYNSQEFIDTAARVDFIERTAQDVPLSPRTARQLARDRAALTAAIVRATRQREQDDADRENAIAQLKQAGPTE